MGEVTDDGKRLKMKGRGCQLRREAGRKGLRKVGAKEWGGG